MSDNYAIRKLRSVVRQIIENCKHEKFKIMGLETLFGEDGFILLFECRSCCRMGIKHYSMEEVVAKVQLDPELYTHCPRCHRSINDYMNQDIFRKIWFCEKCDRIILTSTIAIQLMFPEAKILFSNEDEIAQFFMRGGDYK